MVKNFFRPVLAAEGGIPNGARGATRPTWHALALVFLLAASLPLRAYDFYNPPLRWRAGDIEMDLQLDATMTPAALSDGKTSWNAVAQAALDRWNAHLSRVQFTVFTDDTRGNGNDKNEVFFSDTVYGHAFGDRVLAITTAWRIRAERVEADTIFNTAIQWDSYRGEIDYGRPDLQRVATHEFGHTLGLDHPNQAGQIVPALMNAIISDLDDLTADDILGAHALYPADTNYALTLSVLPPGSGTVLARPAPDTNGLYRAGQVVMLTAKPKPRFRFNFWGGDENKAGRQLKVLVAQDETITVNFSTNSAPNILTPPRSRLASGDDIVTFAVRAQGAAPLSYQWQHDGNDLPGATNASLVLYFVAHEDSGLYSVRVTNARGPTVSKPARLVVDGY